MLRRFFSITVWPVFFAVCLIWMALTMPASAATKIDPYVLQYLKASQSVEVPLNAAGDTKTFTPEQLSEGKRLFKTNCINCHVGGATLPNPIVSLSLSKLKGATPPRDTLEGMVAFMRHPMTYDGTEDAVLCREIPDSWLAQEETENLAAFVLRAAEVARGWATARFE